jgi:membrane protease YdiL (CAAX protease family)
MAPARYAGPVALTLSSVLFGLSHLGGGLLYSALATMAGFGYGWVYQRTGAIEASIGVHFLVNALHFVFFTYPALR